MSRTRAVLGLAAVLCAVPGVAAASTVEVVDRLAVFTGGAGRNDVGMRNSMFIDAAQELTAGAGCLAGLPVSCPSAFHAEINLDGGNDRFRGLEPGTPGYSQGGQIWVNGGSGEDHIHVSGNDNDVSGGPGADWLSVGGNLVGVGYGDGGDDNIRSTSSNSTSLHGGTGDDLVYGQQRWNGLSGDAGSDYVILDGGRVVSRGTMTGGSGDDVMLVGDPPTDFGATITFSGGDGGDLIVGQRRGADAVSGDRGDDVIDVSGDPRPPDAFLPHDTVDCGPGTDDTVYVDADDVVADDCEHRLDGPMPPSKRVDAALARLAAAFGVTIAG